MDKVTLKVEKRELTGRKTKRLRKDGILPANVYGKKVKSQAVQVGLLDFQKVFEQTGETGLVELHVNGDKRPVLVHNVQLDPVSDLPIHVDFLQVDLKVKVTAQIPVELTGESPAEKQGLGTVVQYLDEVEVEALPADLVEKIEVDISNMETVDQAILVKDLKVDTKKIEVKDDLEQIVAKVEPPKEEKEEVAPAAEPQEGEITEGEQAAEQPQGEAGQETTEKAEEPQS